MSCICNNRLFLLRTEKFIKITKKVPNKSPNEKELNMTEYSGMLTQQKDLLLYYGQKLGIDKSDIKDVYFPTLTQLETIMKKEAEPYVEEWDLNEVYLDHNHKVVFPKTLINLYDTIVRKENGLRLLDCFVPEEYGGLGFPPLITGPMLELLAFYDLSLNGTLTLTTTIIEALVLENKQSLSEKYYPMILKDGMAGFVGFTEPGAGSNLKQVKATSTEEGDFFHLKGTKIFITNAGFADLGIVLTRNMENGEAKGTNAFLVHSSMKDIDDSSLPGFRAMKLEKKMGIHASPTGVLELNCVVPKENLLGVRGKGYQTVLERLMGMRMGVSFQGVGVAERAYSMANAYAKDRVQFNKPINTFAGVANKLRGMEINLTRMRKFAFEGCFVLSKFQRAQIPKTKNLRLNAEEENTLKEFSDQYTRGILNHTISKAKMFNTEVAYMIVDDALQIHGGYGFIRDYKVEKLLRDCRILRIYEGTSEIQEYILNRSKGVANAKNMSDLMKEATAGEVPEPMHLPLDYQDLFFRRFGSVMDVYLDDEGNTKYLFDD